MKLGSVAVIGGGPGGLYAARLLKLRHPGARVEVHEQGSPGATFGFGVGLATRTQRNLQAADPDTLADIVDGAWSHDMAMSVGGRRVHLPQDNLLAIGRATLLQILTRHATACGVVVHHDSRTSADDVDADLVIAADGVNSPTRNAHADELGARVDTDHGYYLWCGTDFPLPGAVFSPVHTPDGTFVTHAYPYAPDRSTFLVETDEVTWRRAGFDVTTAALADAPADASDETALSYLSEAFRDELRGHRLLGNRTRWTQFRTVTCRRWHTGRTVLLGDAAHTAHYSIGSGTKLAMEDAITLDRVVADAATIEDALEQYEHERRPSVEHLQHTAVRSMRWWHTFPRRLDLPVEQLFISYMTRAGKVSVDRFAESAADVVHRGLRAYTEGRADPPTTDLAAWILDQPFTVGGLHLPSRVLDGAVPVEVVTTTASASTADDGPVLRLLVLPVELDDPWSSDGAAVVATATEALRGGCDGVLLSCSDTLDAVLTMLDAAERVREETGAVVAVRARARWTDHLAAALASGRADLVELEDQEAAA